MVREMPSDITMARWMQCKTNDILRNNRSDIRCPCWRYKLQCVTEPDSGILQRHLKRNGLMDGYTWWISDEAGEEEDVNGGALVNEEGQPENSGGREDEEHPVHDHEENAEADNEDQDAGHEDSSWVRDPA